MWNGGHFGEGTGDVEQLNCTYTEYQTLTMEQCVDSMWSERNTSGCAHWDDVGVTCGET